MIRPLALLLPLACLLFAPPGAAEGVDPLAAFLPDEAVVTGLQPVIERLESENFAEREAASRELAALPALPSFIRELALTESRPESAQRLRVLADAFPVTEENKRLTAILRDLAADPVKGKLPAICQVMAREVWTPEDHPGL